VTQATDFLGSDSATGQDVIDMTKQTVLSTIIQAIPGDAQLNVNGEIGYQGGGYTNAVQTPVASEPFTTAGTVTMAIGTTVVGAGTAWTTDVLTGPYGVTPNQNKILRGDVLQVLVSAGRYFYFRITVVTNATHLEVWPPLTAGNAAIGAGKTYKILRTGYNSYSRVLGFNTPQGSGDIYYYYCGNLGSSGVPNRGTIQCAAKIFPNTYFTHFMAPQLTDTAGAAVGDMLADDLIYYKGFILYGAGPSISWSAPGAPNTLPFATTDFPAKNISIVDATSNFVSLEYLGDQLVAFFEESMWLVTATGSVPEFAFYKLPELESIINP
jgi:hypothetical protein